MILISNKQYPGYTDSKGDYFLKYSSNVYIKQKKNHLLLFEGWLYPDISASKEDLFNHFILKKKDFPYQKFKGKYSGVYINLETKKVIIFNDQLGIKDLFYYVNKNYLLVSTSFSQLINTLDLSEKDIDVEALNEFITFEHPLYHKTFIKNAKALPLASMYTIVNGTVTKKSYWNYELRENKGISSDEIIERLDKIVDHAMYRIKEAYGSKKVYGLGLSGGMDSKVVAFYAKKNSMRLKTFIFGEENSDAYHIADKIAKQLSLDHKELGIHNNFFAYMDESIEFNPMMNVLYVWYYSIYEYLPQFDVLLTGFNGDNSFGSHIITTKRQDNRSITKKIINKYANKKYKINFQKLEKFISKTPGNTINKTETFNYLFRQLQFIKNNPAFNFLGQYQGESPFEDIDFVEFILTIPSKHKKDLTIYKELQKQKMSSLGKIRPERKFSYRSKTINRILDILRYLDTKVLNTNIFFYKSHKNIKTWLKGNSLFYKLIKKEIKESNDLFKKIYPEVNLKKQADNIYRGAYSSQKINLFFRYITIHMFIKRFLHD